MLEENTGKLKEELAGARSRQEELSGQFQTLRGRLPFPDQDGARQKITAAKHAIEQLSREILQQKRTYHVHEGRFASLKSGLVHFGFEHFARTTKPFYVTDACSGCGLCAAHCPANTISMLQQKPVWAQRCFQCLRCINECPQAAIQYTKATERRGRYTFPHEKP